MIGDYGNMYHVSNKSMGSKISGTMGNIGIPRCEFVLSACSHTAAQISSQILTNLLNEVHGYKLQRFCLIYLPQ